METREFSVMVSVPELELRRSSRSCSLGALFPLGLQFLKEEKLLVIVEHTPVELLISQELPSFPTARASAVLSGIFVCTFITVGLVPQTKMSVIPDTLPVTMYRRVLCENSVQL